MKKTIVITVMAILLAAGAGGAYVWRQKQAAPAVPVLSAPTAPAAPKLDLLAADVATLSTLEIRKTLVATGVVRALRQAQVKSQVSAQVMSVAVTEGQAVTAGQLLAVTDTQDYISREAAQKAALAQANTQVAITQKTVDNNKSLVEKGFISPTAFDASVQQLDAARAAVAVVQANLNLALKALADTRIVSPIAGVVTEKLIQQGDKVSPDMKLFTIIAPGAVDFEGTLPAAEAAQLRVGQLMTIEVEGVPPLQSKVTRINAAVAAGSRNVTFYANLPQTAYALRPGSAASAKIALLADTALGVPSAAVREEAGRSIIYTLTEQGLLTVSPVGVLFKGEDLKGNAYTAIDGVSKGTQYVVRNLGPLRAGSIVSLPKDMLAPATPDTTATTATTAK